ncbi:efflux RND transporter periplasmic adaptor subunit [Shewanella youngdeokensis]|uniref:Efflux RND transporter periplasmic adaptor subunit n=1 Tax=Shewanella youngdeokensis TaxID=2999068 RepID=A0ABZ0K260_9GAMM|nr:efflux RND transporter periplasmic adaptor subunit [Shewanella sp. DAU334]
MSFVNTLKYQLLLFLPLGLLGCGEQTIGAGKPKASLHVDTLTLEYSNIRLTSELPGRITAFKEAEVRPQITGIVQSRLYQEGSFVEAGDVLFQIDPTSYQSTVNSAKAQLKKALANEVTSKKSADRYVKLMKQKLTSQEQVDDANSSYLQAKAEVAIRQAELDYANIELSYTQIKAPISGQAGFSLVSDGSLLTSGQSDYITTIIQTDNVYIDMKKSSVSLYKLKQEFFSVRGKKHIVPVLITLEDGTAYEHEGHLEFVDTQVEGSTGTVTLRAIIPNPDNTLLAGMYVRAHISAPEARDYLIVPQSAVVRSQSGDSYVFVVNGDSQAVKKAVELGNEVGNGWVVKTGLSVGDKVVINNLMNLKNNLKVVVDSDKTTSQINSAQASQNKESTDTQSSLPQLSEQG